MIKTPPLNESITKDNFAYRMRRLLNNEDFRVLQSRWLDIRMKMLDEGKKRPSEAQWSKLDGFDSAIMEPEKWLKYIPREGSDADNDGGE